MCFAFAKKSYWMSTKLVAYWWILKSRDEEKKKCFPYLGRKPINFHKLYVAVIPTSYTITILTFTIRIPSPSALIPLPPSEYPPPLPAAPSSPHALSRSLNSPNAPGGGFPLNPLLMRSARPPVHPWALDSPRFILRGVFRFGHIPALDSSHLHPYGSSHVQYCTGRVASQYLFFEKSMNIFPHYQCHLFQREILRNTLPHRQLIKTHYS